MNDAPDSAKVESIFQWNLENYEDALNELDALRKLVERPHGFKDAATRNAYQRSSFRHFKNLMRQLYALCTTTGRILRHKSPDFDGKNEKLLKYLLEGEQLSEFGLDKDKIDLLLTIRNIRSSLDHAIGIQTYNWGTIGFKQDIAFILYGRGNNPYATDFDPLKKYEAFKQGRLDYDKVVDKFKSDPNFQDIEWVIVIPPIEDIHLMLEELMKIHTQLKIKFTSMQA